MGICCNTGKEDKMCCVPLATGAIIWSVVLIVFNAVLLGVNTGMASLINGVIALCVFSLALVGVIVGTCAGQLLVGSIFLKIATVYCIIDAVWKFITVILVWTLFAALPHEFRAAYLIWGILNTIILIIAASIELSIANGFLSLSFVYDVGGKGMDYRNYQEVKNQKASSPDPEAAVPMTAPTQAPPPMAASEPAPPPPPPAAAEYVQPVQPVVPREEP